MAFIHFHQVWQYLNVKLIWLINWLVRLSSKTTDYIVELGDATRSFWQVCQETMERTMSLQIPLVYLLVLVSLLISLVYYVVKLERKRKTTNMVMFKKIDSLEEQLNMYQRVTQKLDENLERLDKDLKQLEQKHHSEPLSARSDTMNDLLTEVNTQLNKQHQKYESALSRLSDKLATISTDLYSTRAWKLNKSDDSVFTHQLCRSTKDASHLAYLHKNFISALNFLPRMEQLFDLLVELRRQASNSDLDLNWYLAFIDVNQKTDANFIEKIKDHRVQILDLFTDTWHTVFVAQRICWNNTYINFDKEPQTPQYYSSRYWFNIQTFLDFMDAYKCTMNNFTSYWCNRFVNSGIPPKSGVFLMLFTEESLEAYQSTR